MARRMEERLRKGRKKKEKIGIKKEEDEIILNKGREKRKSLISLTFETNFDEIEIGNFNIRNIKGRFSRRSN